MRTKRLATVSGFERLIGVGVLGVAAGAAAAMLTAWQTALLAGWCTTALAYVTWVWATVGRFTAQQTLELSTREDNGRVAAGLLLLTASVASLAGAAVGLIKANEPATPGRLPLIGLAILTVLASWAVVHTVFALHYAHEYYTEPVGGIDFQDPTEPPNYQDFAYLAFTIGMTYQVSDTTIQVRRIRRTVIRHALLAYLFGAVIVAGTVSLITNLIR